MQPAKKDATGLDWVLQQGLSRDEVGQLNPCVPGEFTLVNTYYLNTGSPGVVYSASSDEGTLPLVAGRWYLIPDDIAARHPQLVRETVPVARAARLVR